MESEPARETPPARPAEPPAPPGRTAGATRWSRVDAVLFPAFATFATAWAASLFYGYLRLQTRGTWSAPLDDVFIHFDYARAAARGFPFEWSEGNGYSSGNTSVLYPFALAIGYRLGFTGLALMPWAAGVAGVSVVAFLLVTARLFVPLGRWPKYVLPPAVLSLGALNWSLWSGMENAFHLGVWAAALAGTLAVEDRLARGVRVRGALAGLGLAGAALVATRPESAVCVLASGVFVALAAAPSRGVRSALGLTAGVGAPAVATLAAHAIANRVLTGEWSANGAIAKLALNNPYLTGDEKLAEWLFHLKYVAARNVEHHFADRVPYGYLVLVLALLPLFDRRVRRYAVLLGAQVVGWSLLVALNGQVRWQNERYTMPAVAWLLVLAALGLAVLVGRAPRPTALARGAFAARVAVAIGLAALFAVHQRPNFRDQVWFFGRASRNILEQHVAAGRILADLRPRRVLVGDAGALLYASDRPGLDLIGLGGYHDLPFARAAVHGLGASLELVERMPDGERPDMMALYPTWWGDLPAWFGDLVVAVPVRGNVICGGAEKVLYRARWDALERDGPPRGLDGGERVVDEVDVGDLVSERAHAYAFPRPQAGFVDYRVLPDPDEEERDLFDAGRVVPEGRSETATVRVPPGGGRVVVRSAPNGPVEVGVRLGGRELGIARFDAASSWAEASVPIPPGLPADAVLELTAAKGTFVDYHVWIVSAP